MTAAIDRLNPFAELIARDRVRAPDPRERRAPAVRVLRPTSVEALEEAVARARLAGTPFAFVGGGTAVLATPDVFTRRARDARAAVAFSTELLDRVASHRPADFAITVEAGMRVRALRELLAARGQTLALDTPDAARSTVGGMLACARVGPRRRALGRLSDAMLGAELVLADGTAVRGGEGSLRLTRGYDLGRMLVGSRGALGAFGAVTLRTRPMPEARRCAVATLPEGTRERAVAALRQLPVEPTAALLVDGFERRFPGWEGPDGRLCLFFEGDAAAIDRATRELRILFGSIGIAETRLFDREAESVLEQVIDAPGVRSARESSATLHLHGGATRSALQIRERVRRLTAETGAVTEMICDVQNDDVVVGVRASGPRALEISSREIFIRLAAEVERAELLAAPAAFRETFEEAVSPGPGDRLVRELRAAFDEPGLCGVDRDGFALERSERVERRP